jgi:hypothetical protein
MGFLRDGHALAAGEPLAAALLLAAWVAGLLELLAALLFPFLLGPGIV